MALDSPAVAGAGLTSPNLPGSATVVADAGVDQTQNTLAVVTLDGSGCSGHDSLAWVLTRYDPRDGANANKDALLSDATATSPTFTPEDAHYVYTAQVTGTKGATTAVDSSVVVIDEFILVPLATGGTTTVGGGTFDNTTTWSDTSSTVVLADQHGMPDGGLDADTRTVDLGAIFTANREVTLLLECDNPASGPNSGNGSLMLYVGGTAGLTNAQGYVCGAQKASGGNLKGHNVTRVGQGVGQGDIITGNYRGEFKVHMDGVTGNAGLTFYKGTTTGKDAHGFATEWTGTPSNLFVGLIGAQTSATPGATVTYNNVKLYRNRPVAI